MRSPSRLAMVLLGVLALMLPAAPLASAAPSPGVAALVGTPIRSVYIRQPKPSSATTGPLQVLLVLHGMGANGPDFARDLTEQADRYGWLIVAPTIAYGDWMNPALVAKEDPVLIQAIAEYVDQLPQITGLQVRRRMLLLGHSRGAQLAHRFAEFRPDKVLAVAALSAGTYTLPQGTASFPYGVRDLAQYAGRAFDAAGLRNVQFWLGVGGQDTNAADLPRQWDSYEGTTRVQRAQAFESAMQQFGVSSVLRVFGDTKHDLTGEMRTAACSFLSRAEAPRTPYGTPRSTTPLPL